VPATRLPTDSPEICLRPPLKGRYCLVHRLFLVRARDVIRKIEGARCGEAAACSEGHRRGSHRKFICECRGQRCQTSVPVHPGDLATGTLHKIEKDLEGCLGEGWLI
jgi:predicted RNA binding protein YcfA (HicA-like mRNA interferase family)